MGLATGVNGQAPRTNGSGCGSRE